MKIIKRLLPVLFSLLLVLALSMLCGCSRTDSSDAEEVLKSELDQLKNLDSDTTQKYISYTEMFPDATENTKLSDEIQNVFSLFFQQFDYKFWMSASTKIKKMPRLLLSLPPLMQNLLQQILQQNCSEPKSQKLPRQKQEILKIPPNLWKVII